MGVGILALIWASGNEGSRGVGFVPVSHMCPHLHALQLYRTVVVVCRASFSLVTVAAPPRAAMLRVVAKHKHVMITGQHYQTSAHTHTQTRTRAHAHTLGACIHACIVIHCMMQTFI